jgi:hypothetical protein
MDFHLADGIHGKSFTTEDTEITEITEKGKPLDGHFRFAVASDEWLRIPFGWENVPVRNGIGLVQHDAGART